jgi:hypothetical protein
VEIVADDRIAEREIAGHRRSLARMLSPSQRREQKRGVGVLFTLALLLALPLAR